MNTHSNYPVKAICQRTKDEAFVRQSLLTKPAGSLGMLETIAIQLAGCQGQICPTITHPWISVFAADHGIAKAGVSAFPSVVTQQMVLNFVGKGAAITSMASYLKADFEVVDVGCDLSTTDLLSGTEGLIRCRAGNGTANFIEQAAMNEAAYQIAFSAGEQAVYRALEQGADIFIGGDMGISNTSSATAIICHYTRETPQTLVGVGTGITADQKAYKADVISQALRKHQSHLIDAKSVLMTVGGFEIVALTAAYLTAAKEGLPMIVDGVIASSAALCAYAFNPAVKDWMLFGHKSVEPAQQALFDYMDVMPILDLRMRLGEGTGAAMALPIIQMACATHANMATFEEAEVSGKEK